MEFFINVPVRTSEYFTTVRLTVSGLCAKAGLDLDETEDFKVCVTESMLILKRNGCNEVRVSFQEKDGLIAKVSGDCLETSVGNNIEDEISYALLGALIEDVEFRKDSGVVKEIILHKSL